MRRVLPVGLRLLLVTVLLTGCWDARELEERISVVAVSIDKSDNDQEKNKYKVSIQIPVPIQISSGSGGSGGGGGDNAVKVMSSQGETVAQAFNNLQNNLNQQLFMGHTRIIAVSKDIANEGVADILDGFRRDPSIRRLLWFIIVEGEAKSLLEAKPKLEQIPTVFILSLIENGAKTGRIPDLSLGHFYIGSSNKSLQPIANLVKASEEDIYWKGVALFNKQKMVGQLTPQQSWTLGQLRDELPGGDFLFYPEEGQQEHKMILRPQKLRTSVDVKYHNGVIRAHYNLYVQANIIEKSSHVKKITPAYIKKLENAAEKGFEKNAYSLISKLQNEYGVDALKLGSKVKAYHYKDWKNLKWNKEDFKKAEITVSYDVKFRRTGMQMN